MVDKQKMICAKCKTETTKYYWCFGEYKILCESCWERKQADNFNEWFGLMVQISKETEND